MRLISELPPAVAEVFITDELLKRGTFVPDYAQEKLALQELAQLMADRPTEVLPRLVGLALEICDAESAGISLLRSDESVFEWFSLVGKLAVFEGGTTPRYDSPCGVCLDFAEPVLMKSPERAYSWIREAGISIPEVLLVPLLVNGKEQIGTLWVIARQGARFHQGHVRVMSELSIFTGIALQMIQTEEKLSSALAKQEIMTGEMVHRVKNLFAIAEGMVRMTARTSSTKEDMVERLTGRLHALSSANALVRRAFADEHQSVELSSIFERILKPYNHTLTQIDGDQIPVGDEAINDIALIFHELATNAAKYGALSRDGTVSVRWTLNELSLVIDWIETGGPAVAEPSKTGFGSRLIDATIARRGGSIDYDWQAAGLQARITLPRTSLVN